MPEAYKRCVREVSQKKGVKSANAICTAADAGHVKEVRKQEAMKAKHTNTLKILPDTSSPRFYAGQHPGAYPTPKSPQHPNPGPATVTGNSKPPTLGLLTPLSKYYTKPKA